MIGCQSIKMNGTHIDIDLIISKVLWRNQTRIQFLDQFWELVSLDPVLPPNPLLPMGATAKDVKDWKFVGLDLKSRTWYYHNILEALKSGRTVTVKHDNTFCKINENSYNREYRGPYDKSKAIWKNNYKYILYIGDYRSEAWKVLILDYPFSGGTITITVAYKDRWSWS